MQSRWVILPRQYYSKVNEMATLRHYESAGEAEGNRKADVPVLFASFAAERDTRPRLQAKAGCFGRIHAIFSPPC
jgi:hypothetical protein